MNITELLGQKVGKRMAAFCWAVYSISQTEDFNGKIIIAALTVAYMICQTVSDREKDALDKEQANGK